MARPTKSKEAKPKALEPVPTGGGSGGGDGLPIMQIVITAVLTLVCSTIATAGTLYFLGPMVAKTLIAELKGGGEDGVGEGEDGGPALPSIGPVLDLEEFTVNLNDPGGQRYLRADLSLTVTAEDPQFEKLSGEALHKWEEEFHMEMAHYVPAIRDIVIGSLTRRTAAELGTLEGKQQVKDDIKRSVDGLFHGKHRVIRVNLENFIIQ